MELIATGGTYNELANSDIPATRLSDYTGFPEILDGRVKTLHPKIEGGILARRSNEKDMQQLGEHGIKPIDMVVCNLYPFEKTISRAGVTEEEAIEQIDIGGVTLLRAAAKNFDDVAAVSKPSMYESLIYELEKYGGAMTLETRSQLAREAFASVAGYDAVIANWFEFKRCEGDLPKHLFLALEACFEPKYGENPYQKAMVYRPRGFSGGLLDWKQLAGDTPSFNNLSDLSLACVLLDGFEDVPAAATVKHGMMSGFAFAPTIDEAVKRAHACDSEADYGGVYVLNRKCDLKATQLIGRSEGDASPFNYVEILVAPSYDHDALEVLKNKQKKGIRIFEFNGHSNFPLDLRCIGMVYS